MLKRKNRLVSGVRLNSFYCFVFPQFVLKKKENGLDTNRFGIAVAKKVAKRAVIRNKIKRFFWARLAVLNTKINVGHDILFIVKKEWLRMGARENSSAITNALIKAGLIKTNK